VSEVALALAMKTLPHCCHTCLRRSQLCLVPGYLAEVRGWGLEGACHTHPCQQSGLECDPNQLALQSEVAHHQLHHSHCCCEDATLREDCFSMV